MYELDDIEGAFTWEERELLLKVMKGDMSRRHMDFKVSRFRKIMKGLNELQRIAEMGDEEQFCPLSYLRFGGKIRPMNTQEIGIVYYSDEHGRTVWDDNGRLTECTTKDLMNFSWEPVK